MSDLFLDVLNTSISASWVVLAVLLARLALRKAPRNLICGLWALVALRLVFAGTIEVPFSLMPSSEVIPPESLFDTAPVIDSGVAVIDNVVNPIYTEAFRAVPYASVNPLQIFIAICSVLWIAGMAAMLLWAAWSWLRIRMQVRESVPAGERVYVCDHIDSPFIFGFFVPKIYLPSDLADSAREHVIAHEKAHIARRDHLWKPLAFALLAVNWFNPILWVAYKLLCRDIEMACDERVVRDLSLEARKAYSAALLDCSVTHRYVAACPLAFGEVGVKERVKSVLSYKKPAFWVILLALVLAVFLAVGLLTDPVSELPEIRYNGALYIQDGDAVDTLPDKLQTITELQSVLHDTTPHPEQNGQAVRLGWEYAGQPMYLVGNALYIEEPGGGSWLPFRMKTGQEWLSRLLSQDVRYFVITYGDELTLSDQLADADALLFEEILQEIAGGTMTPYPEWDFMKFNLPSGYDTQVVFYYGDSQEAQPYLMRTAEEGWMLVIRDEDYGSSAWTFESDALDSYLTRYQEAAAYQSALYGALELDTSVNLTAIHYYSRTDGALRLRLGLPTVLTGTDGNVSYWEAEAIESGLGLRLRPAGKEGWMRVYFYSETAEFSSSTHQSAEFTYLNGVHGTKHYTESPDRWEYLQLATTEGQLIAQLEDTDGWTKLDRQVAEAILGSVTVHKAGVSLMDPANLLGIHLSVEDVTPSGLTLVCAQDGTPWSSIWTGTVWSIERYEDGEWIHIAPPEDTAWTTVAFSVLLGETTRYNIDWSWVHGELEPGRYRICKSFSGETIPSGSMPIARETVNQTCYAEFTIE